MSSHFFHGEKLNLFIDFHPQKRSRLHIDEQGIKATICYDLSGQQQKRQVSLLLEKLYHQSLLKVATETLQLLQAHAPRKINNIRIKKLRSRWGSASQDGNINFNLDLAKLPLEVQQYVIIHEYSHLFQMNHSAKFWNVVSRFDPNYKQHRRILRQYEKTFKLKQEKL